MDLYALMRKNHFFISSMPYVVKNTKGITLQSTLRSPQTTDYRLQTEVRISWSLLTYNFLPLNPAY